MKNNMIYKSLNLLFAVIWLINGLICKVLNLVPRHQEIVGRILGNEHSVLLTKLIGFSEILMAVWILSNYKPKLNAWTQIIIILLMNILEFLLVPDLLLWGKFNLIFALIFVLMIYFKEFILAKKSTIVNE